MALKYKFDVLEALKRNGYSTYRIRKEKLLGESTLQKLRQGLPLSLENLDVICGILHCQPGDILEYVENKENEKETI